MDSELSWQASAIKDTVPALDALSLGLVSRISVWYKTGNSGTRLPESMTKPGDVRLTLHRKSSTKKNYAVNSRAVENLLKEQSLVPTTASPALDACSYGELMVVNRTHSRRGLLLSASTYSQCYLSISCTNLNWAYGELCSFIFSGC